MSVAENEGTELRSLLGVGRKLYATYVHVTHDRQEMRVEYCNLSGAEQTLTAALVKPDGRLRLEPRTYVLAPNKFLSIDMAQWLHTAGVSHFMGQGIVIVEQRAPAQGRPVAPAFTSHWGSAAYYCEVAQQAFGNINPPHFKGQKSFYMFCPDVRCDARETTQAVIFNHCSDPSYQDTISLHPTLWADQAKLEGPPLLAPPFGSLQMNVVDHFGKAGMEFSAAHGKNILLTMSHIGHFLASYFFIIDRSTDDIITGQHTYPASAVFLHPGVWWGRLRQFSLR